MHFFTPCRLHLVDSAESLGLNSYTLVVVFTVHDWHQVDDPKCKDFKNEQKKFEMRIAHMMQSKSLLITASGRMKWDLTDDQIAVVHTNSPRRNNDSGSFTESEEWHCCCWDPIGKPQAGMYGYSNLPYSSQSASRNYSGMSVLCTCPPQKCLTHAPVLPCTNNTSRTSEPNKAFESYLACLSISWSLA